MKKARKKARKARLRAKDKKTEKVLLIKGTICYTALVYIFKEANYEACKDTVHQRFQEVNEERRMWRVPDILSVSLQDIMHGWQSDLREG